MVFKNKNNFIFMMTHKSLMIKKNNFTNIALRNKIRWNLMLKEMFLN